MFAEYREPEDPRRKVAERQIAMAWLALMNAERNGEWALAGELAYGTIPRLERELADMSPTCQLHVVREFKVEAPAPSGKNYRSCPLQAEDFRGSANFRAGNFYASRRRSA
jgi:hypothetical protein